MTASSRATPRLITGRMVLVVLVAFFGVIISVNLLMMKLAIETLPGTEVDSAYGASLAFTSELASARAQGQRDWKVTARIARDATGAADIVVDARDEQGAPLSGLTFSSRLEWPTDRRRDVSVALIETAPAAYCGHIDAVAAGRWTLVLEGDVSGQRMFLSQSRVVLK